MKRLVHWAPVMLGLVLLLSLASLQRERTLNGQNDFVQLYTAAKLAGTADLYSRAANLATIDGILGFTMETVVYTRPPFYAALLRPLGALPYLTAYAVFSMATLLSILYFVVQFSKECSALPFFAAMSIPFLVALCNGQDAPLLLPVIGLSMLLVRRKKDFSAGLLLSLCAIKFHLFLFLPVLWVLKKKWRVLGGAVAGVSALTVLGLIVTGVQRIPEYIGVLRDPWINPKADVMPNLHGLVAVLRGEFWQELLLAGVVLFAFCRLAQKSDNYELLFAASLVCGLLVSFHSGIFDEVILFPVFVMIHAACDNVPVQTLSALILTPIPYFMALSGAPYSAALPVLMILLFGMICAAEFHSKGAWRLRPQ